MTGNYVGTPVRTHLGFQFPVLEATVAKGSERNRQDRERRLVA